MAIIQQNMVRIRRMAGNRDQLKGCHGSHGPTKLWSSSLIPLPATRWTMWSDRLPSWPEQVPFEQPLDVRAGKHLIVYMTYYIYIYILGWLACSKSNLSKLVGSNRQQHPIMEQQVPQHGVCRTLTSVTQTAATCSCPIRDRNQIGGYCHFHHFWFQVLCQLSFRFQFHWIDFGEHLNRKPWFLPLNMGVSG